MSQMPVPPAPKAKSKVPAFLMLGCGCLFIVLGMVTLAGYGFARFAKGKFSEGMSKWETMTSTETVSTETTSSESTESAPAAAGTQTYTNSAEGREGELKANYVDFHFDYPSSWEKSDGGGTNFVSVKRNEGGKLLEAFDVGYFQSSGSAAGDEQLYPKLIETVYEQFKAQIPDLQKEAEGPLTVNDYPGYEGRFHGTTTREDGSTGHLYMRVVLLPNPTEGKREGVSLVLTATDALSDVTSTEDVGVKGELPGIITSFRF